MSDSAPWGAFYGSRRRARFYGVAPRLRSVLVPLAPAARPCSAMRGRARPCAALLGHARPCAALRGLARPCAPARGLARP